tara:strand:+ start:617 stop:2008 length:1392 start_codon:yes stop_codon:yes gene_type:complete
MINKKFLISIISILTIFFILGNLTVEKNNDKFTQTLKSFLPDGVKKTLKKTVFAIPVLFKKNTDQDIRLKKLEKDIGFLKSELIKLTSVMQKSQTKKINSKNNREYQLTYYKLNLPSHYDWGLKPVAYIEQNDGFIFLTSGNGNFIKIDKDQLNSEKFNYQIIPTNIKNLIFDEQFYESYILSIKDLLIKDNKIYFSFGNVKDECLYINVFRADINNNELKFSKFFEKRECKPGRDSMNYQHIGGRIVAFDENKILLSVGDFGDEDTPQNKDSIFGKIISINVETKEYEILSSGSRNAQGLYYDNEKNIIINTEHGPTGGDEVNVNKNPDKGNIENFGWPIVSYGTDGDRIFPTSHKNLGFIEPIKYFTPSIGISEVIKVRKNFDSEAINDYFVSALGWKEQMNEGDQSIHQLRFSNDFLKIEYEDIIPIGERIRDIIYIPNNNSYLLVLETVPALGILKIKN